MEYRNKLLRVLTAIACEPWLLTPEMHKVLTQIATAHASGGEIEQAQHEMAAQMKSNPVRREFSILDDIAVVSVEGVIGRKFSEMLYTSGVTSVDIFDRIMTSVRDDEEISAVVLSFDSPGGIAMGVPEAARQIRLTREQKPVVSFVDGLCCSAAYWLASQADAVASTESGEIGSIGCYMAVLDETRAMEMEGMKVEFFKSGKFKGMGYPGTSLSDEQRGMLQDRVNKIANQFKEEVNLIRNVSDDAMQGQTFSAADALARGLIDEVADFDGAMRGASELVKMRGKRKV